MLLTVRAGEQGAEAWAPLPTLVVRGLDLAAADELVQDTFGGVRSDRLASLHRATAGNPLGLLELGGRADDIETVPAESAMAVSDRISRSFIGRASDLREDARLALLVAAADSASAATVHRACAALGVAAASLADAEDAGLVAVRGDRVEFRHPLVRSAVYGAADPETRRAVHRALADAVPPEETSRLAWHLSGSAVAPDEATALTLDAVAGQASGRGAHAIAASAHERAAALTATPAQLAPRLAAAAEAAWLAGLTDRAVDLLDRALAAQPDPYLRAHILELRGAVETRGGSLDFAHELLVAAAREIEDLDPDRAVRMYADAVHVCFYRARADEAQLAADAIERLMETASDADARYLGTVASGMALVLTGEGVRGIEKVRAASYQLVVGGDEPDDEFRLPLRLQGALWVRSSGPHRAAVTAAIDRMRDQAALGSLPYMLMHIARDAATTDRWDDAETAYVEGIRLSRETGQSTDLAASLSGLAVLNARRGKEAECRENIAMAEPLCRANGIRLGEFWLEFAQGDLLAGRGDLAGAARHYESLREGLATTGCPTPTSRARRSWWRPMCISVGLTRRAPRRRSSRRPPRRRDSPGRWRGASAPWRCVIRVAIRRETSGTAPSGASHVPSSCTQRRPTSTRRPAPGSPTARGCVADDSGEGPAAAACGALDVRGIGGDTLGGQGRSGAGGNGRPRNAERRRPSTS